MINPQHVIESGLFAEQPVQQFKAAAAVVETLADLAADQFMSEGFREALEKHPGGTVVALLYVKPKG